MRLAYECYADGALVRFLEQIAQRRLEGLHSGSQGDVINDIVRKRVAVGIVDEDPLSTHHRDRDQMRRLREGQEVDLLGHGDSRVIVLKPDLEGAFLKSLERVGLKSDIATEASRLHALLSHPRTRRHERFRDELERLHAESKARKLTTFTVELEEILRGLP